MNNTDPNKQQHHTFGSTKAAERLKQEIDKGAKYQGAVRILNKGQGYTNDLVYAKLPDSRFFLKLLRDHIIQQIDNCGSDQIVKSLCKNVFTAKCRFTYKVLGHMDYIHRSNKSLEFTARMKALRQLGSARPEEKSDPAESPGWLRRIRNRVSGLLGGDPSK